MRVLVSVFAHNEVETIARGLLGQIGREMDGVKIDVLLVDDGSSDGSADQARQQGFTVLSSSKNVGKAAAIKIAYTYFRCQPIQYDFFITMDGDGQHDPGELGKIIAPLLDGADITLGERFHPESPQLGTPDDRLQLNTMVAAEVGRRISKQFCDVLCGFRGFSARAAAAIIPRLSLPGYGAELETVMTAALVFPDFRMIEVPVSAIYQGTQAMAELYGEQTIAARHLRLIERLTIHCEQLLIMEELFGNPANHRPSIMEQLEEMRGGCPETSWSFRF